MNDVESTESAPWYEAVSANTSLTQGDIIFSCPILQWSTRPFELKVKEMELLSSLIEAARADLIVMTQACDLENKKVSNVILCPHLAIEQHKAQWVKFMEARGQKKLDKAWSRLCEDIKNGYLWQNAMLNEGSAGNLSITHRIVDFSEVYTLPRAFLESLLQSRGESRLRLRPPYREHLSQAFARFFMRVGLPTGINKVW